MSNTLHKFSFNNKQFFITELTLLGAFAILKLDEGRYNQTFKIKAIKYIRADVGMDLAAAKHIIDLIKERAYITDQGDLRITEEPIRAIYEGTAIAQ